MVVAIFVSLSVQPPASACTCLSRDFGFMVDSEVELPANARGLPWSGWKRFGADASALGADPSLFGVAIQDANGWRQVPLTLVPLPDTDPDGAIRLLVAPGDGLQPGAVYRFTFHRSSGVDEVRARISNKVFAARRGTATLRTGPSAIARIDTSTRSGSCRTTLTAQRILATLELAESHRVWAGAFLYEFRVDGQIWHPQSSLCTRTPLGRTSQGVGSEILFTPCGSHSAEAVLESGKHVVEAIAYLPGTSERLVTHADVDLQCDTLR